MKQELADGLTIRKSRIHGNGCFATIPFSKGRKVAHYAGERITWEEASRRRRNHNGHRICDLNSNLSIDGSFGGNGTEHINHSCEPNCAVISINGQINIHAIRDIAPGEEITVDYLGSFELVRLPCACRSLSCRGRGIGESFTA